MAEHLKIKQSTYANYETGFSKPELDTFFSMSKILKISMDELVNTDLSKQKKYAEPGAPDPVADPYTPLYEAEKLAAARHEELLFKIIQLNEKLLTRTEELRIKDTTLTGLAEKIKQLEELIAAAPVKKG